MTTPRQIAAVAIHEAGHAVAHVTLRRRIDRVTIVPDETALGLVTGKIITEPIAEAILFGVPTPRQIRAIEDSIVCGQAGPIAEAKFRGRRNLLGAKDDHEKVVEMAIRMCGSAKEASSYAQELEQEAIALVVQNYPEILVVAQALIERKTLSGVAVRRVLREFDEAAA